MTYGVRGCGSSLTRGVVWLPNCDRVLMTPISGDPIARHDGAARVRVQERACRFRRRGCSASQRVKSPIAALAVDLREASDVNRVGASALAVIFAPSLAMPNRLPHPHASREGLAVMCAHPASPGQRAFEPPPAPSPPRAATPARRPAPRCAAQHTRAARGPCPCARQRHAAADAARHPLPRPAAERERRNPRLRSRARPDDETRPQAFPRKAPARAWLPAPTGSACAPRRTPRAHACELRRRCDWA
jgi:hypothetical protein